ncbi:MAG: hypothetical protein Q8O72_03085 [Bacteroidales bacterium]|nr:hypothetical protein [Bacteroidales bacterium]
MKKLKIPFVAFLLVVTIAACNHNSSDQWTVPVDAEKQTTVTIHRYGRKLFSLDTSNLLKELQSIQPQYRAFIGNNFANPNQFKQLYQFVTDTMLIRLNQKTQEVYPNLNHLEDELSLAFSRFHYFFPKATIPSVYSYVSGMYYENPVEINDTLLVVALDVYLGSDFAPYRNLGLPHYRIRRMAPDYVAIDVMKALYNTDINPKFQQKTLLDRMIGAGKLMVFLDAVLPQTADTLKMGYTTAQWNWMEENKENAWAFLVKGQLFYSSDYDTQTKLIQDAPFTTGFSNESAPRIGIWLGWQIVNAYHANHPEVSLSELILNPDSQEILQKSGYKP